MSELTSTFQSIRKVRSDGTEFWLARELAPLLDYQRWENFPNVIEKAKLACEKSGYKSSDHFRDITKMVQVGSGAARAIPDYLLSRYACYLIVQNGDSSKLAIAQGQTYFAVKTRQQEISEQSRFGQLPEEDRRLLLREELAYHNKSLSAAAKSAGVEAPVDYAIFQDHGYRGLYGGLGQKELHVRRGLGKSQKILDHMGSTELAANLFRATQTEEKLRRDQVKGKTEANKTHFEVGKKVRQTISELGGTMPELLPKAPKSIQQLKNEQKRALKNTKDKALVEETLSEEVKTEAPVPLPTEVGDEYTAQFDPPVLFDCPACLLGEVSLGTYPCKCPLCGAEWGEPRSLADALGWSRDCSECDSCTVVKVWSGYACVGCGCTIVDSEMVCKRCGGEVPLEERDVFEEQGLCGWCSHQEEKDD